MSEIDYEELDKEVGKVMAEDSDEKVEDEVKEKPIEASEVHVKPRIPTRGRYMDMVHKSSDMRPAARSYATGKTVEVPAPKVVETAAVTEVAEEDEPEFGVVTDVKREAAERDFVAQPEPMRDLPVKDDLVAASFEEYDEEEPDANNYSLGGRSPFIPDAKVEKRPLGDYVPNDSARGVNSTKNVYSQRAPMEQMTPDVRPMVIGAPRKKPGWLWALMTLLVILIGGGLGVLAFVLYNQ